MKIIKTTEYFNMSEEQAGECIYDNTTREVAKILDSGLVHVFFETLVGLEKEYNSEYFKNFVEKHNYDVLIFELVADNDNNIKYAMVFK